MGEYGSGLWSEGCGGAIIEINGHSSEKRYPMWAQSIARRKNNEGIFIINLRGLGGAQIRKESRAATLQALRLEHFPESIM